MQSGNLAHHTFANDNMPRDPHAYNHPVARRSVRTADNGQDRPFAHPSSGESSKEAQDGAGKIEVTKGAEPTSETTISKPAATSVKSSVYGSVYGSFDIYAYGDPSRKKQIGATSSQDTRQEPAVAPEPGATAKKADVHSQPSPATPTRLTAAPSSPRPSSSHMYLTPKADSVPPPATFDSLKQGNETPQQLIARLQAAGRRDAFDRIKRNDTGEIPTSTALDLLDLLRKPVPSLARGSDANVTSNTTTHLPLPKPDPNPTWNPSSPVVVVAHTDNGIPESKEQRKEGRQKEANTNNPALWKNAAAHMADASTNGRAHQDEQKEERFNTVRHRTVKTGTRIGNVNDRWPTKRPENKELQNSRWATNEELKAPPVKPDSNTEGSEESESIADSTRPIAKDLGRLIRSRKPPVAEEPLAGWDGQIQPPPPDWESRPRFHNNTPEYISGFENWLGEVAVRTVSEQSAAAVSFSTLAVEEVENIDNHPDGIGFVPRETILRPSNSQRYGHMLIAPIVTGWQDKADFKADAKLDLSDPQNVRYKDETAEMYIARRMQHIKLAKQQAEEQSRLQKQAEQQQRLEAEKIAQQTESADPSEIQEVVNEPSSPITNKNIYLRPAVEADAQGMANILNWHIVNGIRPCELAPVPAEEMIGRLEVSQHARLPVIVAVERTRKTAQSRKRKTPRVRPNHPIQNIDPEYIGVMRDEPIVGWVSATDWAASHYVESTSVEIELYVLGAHRKGGVGRCLMDAILDATDRGYTKKGGYEFRVAPEMKHLYTGGGGRDVNKLLVQVRSYSKPKTPQDLDRIDRISRAFSNEVQPHHAHRDARESQLTKKDFSKEARLDDREDDYVIWLKEWLESNGFEEEAYLKKMGTKHHRFVDLRMLTRETSWQPTEGRIPDFTNGF